VTSECRFPPGRLDVEREVDLLEELARIHGYNQFPNTLPAFTGAVVTLPDEPKNAKVRETNGSRSVYDEAISITLYSPSRKRKPSARRAAGPSPIR